MTEPQGDTAVHHIYPIDIPDISVEPNLDFLLLELPPRYLPMVPNGLAYVDLLLRREGFKTQLLDIGIILYHRYHQRRLLEGRGPEVLADGSMLDEDPWSATGVTEFSRDAVVAYFWPQLEVLIALIEERQPKVLGLSLNGSNNLFSQRVIEAVRQRVPNCCILVGGYSCVNEFLGPRIFSSYDYMVMGEAEVSLPPLAHALMRGERPKDLPGIHSRWDSPTRTPVQFLRPQNLDALGWPKYEWVDLAALYRTYNRSLFMPISGSRGCSWGRCRFCAERFPYRSRSPESVVDEIQYFYEKGVRKFHFNESDVNGNPQLLHNMCTEIMRRGIVVHMMGQLRIDKRINLEFLQHLAQAGFRHLRFGVDGWSFNVLRLQKKGYNTRLIKDVLKSSYLANIWTTVNVVVGVPGETAADIEETIENLLACRGWIRRVESFNALILAAGSEYYLSPEEYGIKFVEDKNELYETYKAAIPEGLWYSERPYIDAKVRARRIYRIKKALNDVGMPIGMFTLIEIDRILLSETGEYAEVLAKPGSLPEGKGLAGAGEEYGNYKIYKMGGAFIALHRVLWSVAVETEKVGDRDVLPYIALGTSERETVLKLRSGAREPDIDDYVMVHSENRVVAIHRSIPREAVGRDLLVAWDIAPFVLSGTERQTLCAALDGMVSPGVVAAPH